MTDEELNRKFDIVAAHLASLAVSQQKAEERMDRADDRLSRLERTLLLAIRAGRRERGEWRERHAALVDAQMRTEAAMAKLTESQTHADRRLDALIDIVREERNGKRERLRRDDAKDDGDGGEDESAES